MDEFNEYIKQVDELAYDILMSLRTGLPVSVKNEYELCALLDDENPLDIVQHSKNLYDLQMFFLDNGEQENAWNICNLLIGGLF